MDALEAMGRLLRGEGLTFNNGETLYLADFAAFHASPPCQSGSEITPVAYRHLYPNLIPDIRMRFIATIKPYVIENVECMRQHLRNPVELCGTQFGLRIWRHRFFEIYPEMFQLMSPCNHSGHPILVTGTPKRNGIRIKEPSTAILREAMQTPWMTKENMDEAFPPVYTEYIGKFLMQAVSGSLSQPAAGN
jgi:DNA (cytosine-5)-methyltransferase 1